MGAGGELATWMSIETWPGSRRKGDSAAVSRCCIVALLAALELTLWLLTARSSCCYSSGHAAAAAPAASLLHGLLTCWRPIGPATGSRSAIGSGSAVKMKSNSRDKAVGSSDHQAKCRRSHQPQTRITNLLLMPESTRIASTSDQSNHESAAESEFCRLRNVSVPSMN